MKEFDRCVANEEWVNLFPSYSVKHLPHNFSDHCPLFVKTVNDGIRKSPRPLCFESWWFLEEFYEEDIRHL